MIIKCVNGYLFFTFSSIQEVEVIRTLLPIPNLVPVSDTPFTFIPEAQASIKYIIAGNPINRLVTPIISNEDVIKGFEANRLTYSFTEDAIIMRDTVTRKVELSKNRYGKYFGTFMLQPYSLVGFSGRAGNYECEYNANTGMFVYDYIRFEL